MIETDAHLMRELPAGYVAEHVEHAYALTGHGMQGGTVEQAVVARQPARPHARLVLHRALQRARRDAAVDHATREPTVAGARGVSRPPVKHAGPSPSEVLARVARRMLERDDEDLAIDQLPVAGPADDPDLNRALVDEPLQEHAAERAEPEPAETSPRPLGELRERVEQLQAQLAVLPGELLWEFDELQRRAVELTQLRDRIRDSLAKLPEPKTRLLGRVDDPHITDRHRLGITLEGTERSLERSLNQRDTLARQLGNPESIRSESDGLRNALQQAHREHDQILDGLVERELATRPGWAREALGERPAGAWRGQQWDQAADKLARYRITYNISDSRDALGPEPPMGQQRDDYERAQRAVNELGRTLEREAPGHDLDLGR